MQRLIQRVEWRWDAWQEGRRLRREGGELAHRVPARWLRRARIEPGDRVCVFVAVARAGTLLPHSVDHAAAWQAAGYKVVLAIVVDALDDPIDTGGVDFAAGIMLRVNKGYDFGAWASVIRALGNGLATSAMLALANDSVLGPSDRFADMVARAQACDADLIGLVASDELRPHLQSFCLFFKPRALGARAFGRFWRGVRSGDRRYVIDQYETALAGLFEAAGLRTAAVFDGGAGTGNATLSRWRQLIDAGFPYIKAQLLRDNPAEVDLTRWRSAAAAAGFDGQALDRQVAALRSAGPAPWQAP